MEVNPQQAEKIVADVQVAHRMVVAYYERLLPELDSLATGIELDFWYWEPLHTAKPGRSSTQPTKNWLWDMVPLFASRHVYRKVVGEQLRSGDLVLVFDVYADDGFKPEARKTAGIKGNPKALTVPQGEGVIEAQLYRCTSDSEERWGDAWGKTDEPDPEIASWQRMYEGVEGFAFNVPLCEFICDSTHLANKIRELSKSEIQEGESRSQPGRTLVPA